jgi:hypothetical protein
LNDNAPDPFAVIVKRFLMNRRDGHQPPTKNVTPKLISIPIKAFDDCFAQFLADVKQCAAVTGVCSEGK